MAVEQDNCVINEIWHKYQPKILSLCKFKLQSCPEEAEDVMLEVFDALVVECRKRKVPEKPEAWLFKVAYNLINKKYAEIKKRKESELYVDFRDGALSEKLELQVTYDFTDEMIDDMDIEQLKERIMNDLTDDEREIIELVHEKKLKLKEVASIMNCTPQAIKQKIYRIRIKIKRMAKESIEKFS